MRGRRPLPDAIHELRGNPGKRKRFAVPAVPPLAPPPQAATEPPPDALDLPSETPAVENETVAGGVEIPAFLTQPREREIFRKIVGEYLERRIAQKFDVMAFARWASYMDKWIACKLSLDGKLAYYVSESPHGKYFRRHPVDTSMNMYEGRLIALEDRLGLNPIARQNILRSMMLTPPPGDLFNKKGETPPATETKGRETEQPALGWMQNFSGTEVAN